MPEVSRERRLELASDADELLRSPAFDRVVNHLVAEQVKSLVGNPIGSLTATEAHATLRALDSLKATLRAIASDRAMVEKQG